jgi:hypothetical protein
MSVDGVRRISLRRFEDVRGWFCELRRDSALPKPTVQTNLSFSRKGVIRGLHFHESGQDDLFVCLQGTARVVVLDRTSGAPSAATCAVPPTLAAAAPWGSSSEPSTFVHAAACRTSSGVHGSRGAWCRTSQAARSSASSSSPANDRSSA